MLCTFLSSWISQCSVRKMFLTSISKCISSMHLSLATKLNTGCLNEVSQFLLSSFHHAGLPSVVVGLLLPLLLFIMAITTAFPVSITSCVIASFITSDCHVSFFLLAYSSLVLLTAWNLICLVWSNNYGIVVCIFISCYIHYVTIIQIFVGFFY